MMITEQKRFVKHVKAAKAALIGKVTRNQSFT